MTEHGPRSQQRAGFASMVTVALSGFVIVPAWWWAVARVLGLTVAVWVAVELRAVRDK